MSTLQGPHPCKTTRCGHPEPDASFFLFIFFFFFFLPAGHAICARPAGPKLALTGPKLACWLVLRLFYVFHTYLYLGLFVPTYHVRYNYVMHIVSM